MGLKSFSRLQKEWKVVMKMSHFKGFGHYEIKNTQVSIHTSSTIKIIHPGCRFK